MRLFRVENRQSNAGLWYHLQDQTLSPVVHTLDLSGKGLPMDFDASIASEKWRSAAESVDQLKFWFNHDDLKKLIPLGYKLYEIESEIFKINKTEWYTHPLYQEAGVKFSRQLDIDILLPSQE